MPTKTRVSAHASQEIDTPRAAADARAANKNNARSSRKRAQARGRFHRYFRCFRHFRCRMYRCCRRSWRRQMRAHRQSADMHFTWRAWDKTQFRAGLFRKCVCVASAWVCCGNPVRETKNAFFCVKTLNANFRKACSHAFYVACVGQHPGSFSSVCELCLRSVYAARSQSAVDHGRH